MQPANGSDFTLEEMQAIVGGYIELVELDGSTNDERSAEPPKKAG